MGKSFIALALGSSAIRVGFNIRFLDTRIFLRARVDNFVDRSFCSLPSSLQTFSSRVTWVFTASPGQQSADLYRLIVSRHRVSSFVITSNRDVEEWPILFDEPILGNGALDRLANASCQLVIEGTSYGERLSTQ